MADAFFGIGADKVMDTSNWEQLGLVVRLVDNWEQLGLVVRLVETIVGELYCIPQMKKMIQRTKIMEMVRKRVSADWKVYCGVQH